MDFDTLIKSPNLIDAVLCQFTKTSPVQKIHLRPLTIKQKSLIQFSFTKGNQVVHKNFSLVEAIQELEKWLDLFKEAHFFLVDADINAFKGITWTFKNLPPSKKESHQSHNRLKQYKLPLEKHELFWQALGIATKEGKILSNRAAKFKQVNHFIEIVESIVEHLPMNKPLQIVDFGCGKGYLTFALYHYLTLIKNFKVNMVGLDIKADLIKSLNTIAQNQKYHGLKFQQGTIKETKISECIDLALSLHACDTATDDVLKKAVSSHAKVILSVPCCHHAAYRSIRQEHLRPLLKHNILKERLAALATDAQRALWLETNGYETSIIEFIDTEHTPKNLLIRAIKSKNEEQNQKENIDEWLNFNAYLNIPNFL